MPDSDAYEHHPDQGLVPRWCADHFGIEPAVFAEHVFWRPVGGRLIRVAARACRPPEGMGLDSIGMQVMRRPPPRGKPTSVFLQRFGGTATRNVYRLDDAQTDSFLRRMPVSVRPVDDARGYAIVFGPDGVLGCGRVDGELLRSEIPKAWLHDG